MAHTRGCYGIVQVGATPTTVAEVRSWELEQSADVLDVSALGSACAKTYDVGAVTWTGSLTCWWDPTDTTGQEALDVGTTVTLKLSPGGTDTGDVYYTGSAIVTSISRTGSVDGVVEATFNFQGSGALAQGTH